MHKKNQYTLGVFTICSQRPHPTLEHSLLSGWISVFVSLNKTIASILPTPGYGFTGFTLAFYKVCSRVSSAKIVPMLILINPLCLDYSLLVILYASGDSLGLVYFL